MRIWCSKVTPIAMYLEGAEMMKDMLKIAATQIALTILYDYMKEKFLPNYRNASSIDVLRAIGQKMGLLHDEDLGRMVNPETHGLITDAQNAQQHQKMLPDLRKMADEAADAVRQQNPQNMVPRQLMA